MLLILHYVHQAARIQGLVDCKRCYEKALSQTNKLYMFVLQSVSSSTNDALFSGSAGTDSWPVSSDSTVVSWDTQTVNDSTASTAPTSDTRQKAPDNSTHCLERY